MSFMKSSMLIFAIMTLGACDQAVSSAGCHQKDEHVIARFNRNCINKQDSEGYFTVPFSNVHSCTIQDKNSYIPRFQSSGSKLKISVPISNKTKNVASVIVNIAANEESRDATGCEESDRSMALELLEAIKSKRPILGKLTEYGDGKHRIQNFKFEAEAVNSYDLYFRTNDKYELIYWAACVPDKRCAVSRFSILDGKYYLGADFPYQYRDSIFEIIEESKSFTEKLYIEEAITKER